MGKSPESKPEMAFGLFRRPQGGEFGAGHIISNSPDLTVQITEEVATNFGAEVVVVEGKPLSGDNSSKRSFGQVNWGNSEWQPSGSAWTSTKPGHA